VEQPETADEHLIKRGPAMLLMLFLSLFVSAPAWTQAPETHGPTRIDRPDVQAGAWSARLQGQVVKAKKAPKPFAVLPPPGTPSFHSTLPPATAATATAEIPRVIRRAAAYQARAPPAL
jgi:hypothetical protein